jgi:hypothetical protein
MVRRCCSVSAIDSVVKQTRNNLTEVPVQKAEIPTYQPAHFHIYLFIYLCKFYLMTPSVTQVIASNDTGIKPQSNQLCICRTDFRDSIKLKYFTDKTTVQHAGTKGLFKFALPTQSNWDDKRLTNTEPGTVRKKMVVTLKYCPCSCLEVMRKITERLSQHNLRPGRDLNTKPPLDRDVQCFCLPDIR